MKSEQKPSLVEETAVVSKPFANLADLALPQDFNSLTASVEYSHIPCRKPGKQAFVRVSPKPEHRGNFAMLEVDSGIGGDKEQFIVVPQLMAALGDLPGLSARMLVLGVCRPENSPFLWPLRLPNNNLGRQDNWALSALEIAKRAESKWLRVMPNMQMGCYTATVASADWPEPEWPELAFDEVLDRSLGGNLISHLSHPAIKALQGKA